MGQLKHQAEEGKLQDEGSWKINWVSLRQNRLICNHCLFTSENLISFSLSLALCLLLLESLSVNSLGLFHFLRISPSVSVLPKTSYLHLYSASVSQPPHPCKTKFHAHPIHLSGTTRAEAGYICPKSPWGRGTLLFPPDVSFIWTDLCEYTMLASPNCHTCPLPPGRK